MDPNTQRAEAERWLGIAAKLLTARDFLGSRTFAIRARESDPNNSVSDQILAVVDTVLAGEKRVNSSQQPDWYAVLQLPRLVRDPDLIATHYRRLVLLLNPERNRLPFADYALQLVMDGWAVLSDPTKKWLFDNELALSLQRQTPDPQPPIRVDPVRVDPAAVAAAAATSQLNTFQFFQPQPQQPPPQQPTLQMWQQPPTHHHQQNQIEFMSPPHPQPPPPPPPPSSSSGSGQLLPPQWQMRDPTTVKGGGGERNKGSVNGIGGAANKGPQQQQHQHQHQQQPQQQAAVTSPTARARAMPPPPAPVSAPAPPPIPPPSAAPVTVAVAAPVMGRMSGGAAAIVADGNVSKNNNDNINGNGNDNNNNVGNETNDDGEREELECFWTACPYCFYIYEYHKMYQDCTLRCQNCRRGFHAVQIPNPPPIVNDEGRGGGKNGKESSFCCWGFLPLGFSMTAWKKHNQLAGQNGSSNWVPFSPMFACPTGNAGGGGNFQWFASDGTAAVGPKNIARKNIAPRVYIDDYDDEDNVYLSDTGDSDSSDTDWRRPGAYQKKRRHHRVRIGGGRRGRPRKVDTGNQAKQVSVVGGVSVGGEDMEDGSSKQVVIGLVAGARADASKNVASTVMRKQTRRSMKDMGRLDLNVEFNNEGDDHAPTVSAVNGEEEGIENIGFFEGLDEFLSTLPILNVGGDEKAKPS